MTALTGDPEGAIILGPPRSGTTLLRRLLDAHPAISCPPEPNLFSACARFLREEPIAEGIKVGVITGLSFSGIPEEDVLVAVRELAFGIHRRIAASAGKRRWVSKTAFDAFYVDEIERLCAGHVRFVCVTRHALDVVCSLRELCDKNETYLSEVHAYVARHASPPHAFAHLWVDLTHRIARLATDHPESALTVRYEDLVAKPAETVGAVVRFLGEVPDASVVEHALERKVSVGLGDWKTYRSQRIEPSSVGRWKELSPHTVSGLARIVNPTLESAGYEAAPTIAERGDVEARRRYEMGLGVQGLKRPRRDP